MAAVGTNERLGAMECWTGGFLCQCFLTVAGWLCACRAVGLIGGGARERLLAVGGGVCGDEQFSGVRAIGSLAGIGVITTELGVEMRTAVKLGNVTGVRTC